MDDGSVGDVLESYLAFTRVHSTWSLCKPHSLLFEYTLLFGWLPSTTVGFGMSGRTHIYSF